MNTVTITHVRAAFARYARALMEAGLIDADGTIADIEFREGERSAGIAWRVHSIDGVTAGFEGGMVAPHTATRRDVFDRFAIAASAIEAINRRDARIA